MYESVHASGQQYTDNPMWATNGVDGFRRSQMGSSMINNGSNL